MHQGIEIYRFIFAIDVKFKKMMLSYRPFAVQFMNFKNIRYIFILIVLHATTKTVFIDLILGKKN